MAKAQRDRMMQRFYDKVRTTEIDDIEHRVARCVLLALAYGASVRRTHEIARDTRRGA